MQISAKLKIHLMFLQGNGATSVILSQYASRIKIGSCRQNSNGRGKGVWLKYNNPVYDGHNPSKVSSIRSVKKGL